MSLLDIFRSFKSKPKSETPKNEVSEALPRERTAEQNVEERLEFMQENDLYSDTDVIREPHEFSLLKEQVIPGFDFSEVFEIRMYDRNQNEYFDTYYLCPNMAKTVREQWKETYPKIVAVLSEQGRNSEIPCYDLRPETLHFDSNNKTRLCSGKLCELHVTPKTPTGKKPKYPFSVRIEGYNRKGGCVFGILHFLYDGTIGRVEVSSSDMGEEYSGFSKTF